MAKNTPNNTSNPQDDLLDPSRALAFAERHGGHYDYDGYCAKFTQTALAGHSGVYPSAKAWYNASVKNKAVNTTKMPPAGAAVFYKGDPTYGHVAVSAGNGYVWSTGVGGKVEKVPYNKLWGGSGSGSYLGWTSKIGGKYVNVDRSTLKPLGSPIAAPSSTASSSITKARGIRTASRASAFASATSPSSVSGVSAAPMSTSSIIPGVTSSPTPTAETRQKMVAY